jgi:ankyrin repeat protein
MTRLCHCLPGPGARAARVCFAPILPFPDTSTARRGHPDSMNSLRIPVLLSVFFGLLLTLRAADPLSEAFQRGLLAEETRADFQAASAAYGEVIRLADAQRDLIATALFRLSETQRRLSRTNDAIAGYRRLIREFSTQTNLVALATERLQALGGAETPQKSRDPSSSLAAPLKADEGATDPESRELDRLRRMLVNSPDLIDAPQGENKETPLQTAARLDHGRVVEFLLSQRVDPKGGAQDRPPLHLAAGAGHKRLVELLLKAGVPPDQLDKSGMTPLHWAVRAGRPQVVQSLLASGARPSIRFQGNLRFGDTSWSQLTPLGIAVMQGNRLSVELLEGAGASLNEEATRDRGPNSYSYSPLLLALHNRDGAMAQRLLELGADPTLVIGERNPLLEAIAWAPVELLDRLVGGRSKLPESLASQGPSLLQGAMKAFRPDGVDWLLAHGVSADEPDDEGLNSLHYLVSRNQSFLSPDQLSSQLKIADALLKAHANPNRLDRHGQTPLVIAAFHGWVPGVERLLQSGGNPNTLFRHGPPMIHALLKGQLDQRSFPPKTQQQDFPPKTQQQESPIDLLLTWGADPNSEHEGQTLLGMAASGDPQWVRRLLDAKADPNRRPRGGGPTPLELVEDLVANAQEGSSKKNAVENARLLRAAGAKDRLPNFGAIQVVRKQSGRMLRTRVFRTQATNDPNAFTLLELLAAHQGPLVAPEVFRMGSRPETDATGAPAAGNPAVGLGGGLLPGGPVLTSFPRAFSPSAPKGRGFAFPDWRRVVIHRPSPDATTWEEIPVDVDAWIASGDCLGDKPLKWGDLVELPERDHPLYVADEGAPKGLVNLWTNCLTRTVEFRIRGETRSVKLSLAAKMYESQDPFSLNGALRQPSLLRTTSDLRNLRIERRGPTGVQTWNIDGSDAEITASFWLRDGDRIEVPDLPTPER